MTHALFPEAPRGVGLDPMEPSRDEGGYTTLADIVSG